ncbi:MAG: hypothetical protein MRJ96_06875 [Nitrospirales bacterium]|nr:hypothetical protein [Nitrospirales bacterium]
MGKSSVPFIALLGVVLLCGVTTSNSHAVTFGANVVSLQNQWAIDQDVSEHSSPFTLVKKEGGKGKKSHEAKGSKKHKGEHKRTKRGNSGESKVHGMDRAHDVAGEHGEHGRAKARAKHDREHHDDDEE